MDLDMRFKIVDALLEWFPAEDCHFSIFYYYNFSSTLIWNRKVIFHGKHHNYVITYYEETHTLDASNSDIHFYKSKKLR